MYMRSTTDYTLEALERFAAREKIRRSDTHARRIILTLVGSGKERRLEAREDTIIERIKIFFCRSDYKLARIQAFINTLPIDHATLDRYNELLSQKGTKRLYLPDFSPLLRQTPPLSPPDSGYGMQNPGINACFLNATVQALGKSPTFRELLNRRQLEQNSPIQLRCINTLQDIYSKLEKHTVGVDEIQNLRQLLIESGFCEDDTTLTSQEDAGRLAMHLLDLMGLPIFSYAMDISYDVGFPVPALDRQKGEQIVLPVSIEPKQAGQSLQQRVQKVEVKEYFEKQAIRNANDRLTRGQLQRLNNMPNDALIDTVQSVAFIKDREPRLLPICLKRYSENGSKIHTPILPSQTIDFPIRGLKRQAARYRLVAVVVHEGSQIRSGHFYAFVPKVEHGTTRWTRYDDSVVSVLTNEQALQDIATKGYVFYYEYVGRVKKGKI